jgi:2-methylisocitrate lyase-like PEP mutase family enzyme
MSEKSGRREFLQSAGLTAAGLTMAASPLAAGMAPATPTPAKTMGGRFRELLQKRDPFHAIAAYDVYTARMVQEFGFPALFMGGSLTGDFYAQPLWLRDLSDRIDYIRHIAENVEIPTLVDVDDGGDPLKVYRVTKELERANAGAIHILDSTVGPMGTVPDPGVIPVAKMVDKIHAAVDARSDLVVTVRCGAGAMGREGKAGAIARGIKYAEAGCETIWFTGLMLSDLPEVADAIKIPVTAQFTATNTVADARSNKVVCMVYASILQNIAQSAVYDALTELKTTGTMTKIAAGARLGGHVPPEFRQKLLRTPETTELGKKYNVGN